MGLLMKFIAVMLVVILAIGVLCCNSSRLVHSVMVGPNDWMQYGGSIERTNVAHTEVVPPLSLAWTYDASAGFSPFASAVADSMLFIGDLQGEVHAVQIRTGSRVGSYKFGSAITGTPVIDNGRIYVALTQTEESLVSFNTLTGTIEWRAKLGDIESSPLAVGTWLFVTTLDGSLVCVAKADGTIRWKYRVPAQDRAKLIHSSPASDGHIVVFGCDDGVLYAVGANDGALLWKTGTRGSILGSPSIDNDNVFIGSLDSSVYCIDLHTGITRWRTPLGARIFSSQAIGNHRVFVGTAGREVRCLDAETGTTVWIQRTDGVVNSPPLLAGTVLYVGCIDKKLYAFDAKHGNKIWEYRTEGRIKTMPVAADNYLFVLAEDRSVLGFTHERAK
jgi:eukaryotic-like serine/threonine-protein kinase